MQLHAMKKKNISVFCWRQGQGPEQPDSNVKVCPCFVQGMDDMTFWGPFKAKLFYDSKTNKMLSLGQCFSFEEHLCKVK